MKVIIADDQQNVRAALRLLLEQEPGVHIAGEAADVAGLLLLLEREPADLLLLDCELPGIRLRQLLYLIQHEQPFLAIVGLSGRPEARQLAFEAGVDDFISKSEPPDQILFLIRHRIQQLQHYREKKKKETGTSPSGPGSPL